MAKGIEITLVASQYAQGGKFFQQPFKTILPEKEAQVNFFRNAGGAFKLKTVDIPESAVFETETTENTDKDESLHYLIDIEGIDEKLLKLLVDAGFETAEKVLSDETKFDDLTDIKGIGEATANKLIELCEEATKVEDENEGGEEDE